MLLSDVAPSFGAAYNQSMTREEWLKAVYLAACRVAEKHGAGLRKALESKDDDGRVRDEIFQAAADAIAAGGELWPFIVFSRRPEPKTDAWRKASSFEGAVVQVAVAAHDGGDAFLSE